MSLESNQFTELVRPVIDDLYRNTPAGKRPDANVLAAKIYDALDAARVEVTIRQPPGASGGGKR